MDALPRRQLRALFLSDVHLGMRGSQSARLADFLRYHEAEAIYLVGDIVDGWRLRKRWHWSPAHNAVIAELLAAAQRGARVVYLPGNHDAFLRD
jgi:UDP-2,3-diacylglucosamine pyrophosphatase LpxH